MQTSALEEKISAIIAPSLEEMGYEIVRVQMQEGHRKILQIMLDRADDTEISIDDCERASRQISALMDVEDPIAGNYNLEVSSPGIDRPLTRKKDFERYKGFDAKIALLMPQNGRKRFSGALGEVKEETVMITLSENGEEVELPFDQISTAKLVMNDALLAANSNK